MKRNWNDYLVTRQGTVHAPTRSHNAALNKIFEYVLSVGGVLKLLKNAESHHSSTHLKIVRNSTIVLATIPIIEGIAVR